LWNTENIRPATIESAFFFRAGKFHFFPPIAKGSGLLLTPSVLRIYLLPFVATLST
jgi:hypothetical protein